MGHSEQLGSPASEQDDHQSKPLLIKTYTLASTTGIHPTNPEDHQLPRYLCLPFAWALRALGAAARGCPSPCSIHIHHLHLRGERRATHSFQFSLFPTRHVAPFTQPPPLSATGTRTFGGLAPGTSSLSTFLLVILTTFIPPFFLPPPPPHRRPHHHLSSRCYYYSSSYPRERGKHGGRCGSSSRDRACGASLRSSGQSMVAIGRRERDGEYLHLLPAGGRDHVRAWRLGGYAVLVHGAGRERGRRGGREGGREGRD